MDRVLNEILRFQKDRLLDKKDFNIRTEVVNILSEIYEMFGYKGEVGEELAKDLFDKEFAGLICVKDDDLVDAFCDIQVFSIGAISKLKYNPIIALEECAKEINSREGSIIDGKFQKDKSPEAQAKWYKANFSRARLEPYDKTGYIPEYFSCSKVN